MLHAYGWSDELQDAFEPFRARGLAPARVTVQQSILTLVTEEGEVRATLGGRFVHEAGPGELPVAGDWVGVSRSGDGAAIVHALVPRRTAFVRRAPGDSGQVEQVVAANADLALLVAALTRDLNLRRLERYLALAWTSGAQPAILLTKADLADDLEAQVAEVEAIAFGVPILVLSVVDGRGLDELAALLQPGKTAVLLGSSGAGKSTLVNALAGVELMATGATRADDERGRHTTTHRELLLLPSGTLLLDTPGMRELGVVEGAAGVGDAFPEVEELALQCRFSDCAHETEPGCAIQAALDDGTLDPERWESFLKLEREQAWLERKGDPLAQAAARRRWKAMGQAGREAMKAKGRR